MVLQRSFSNLRQVELLTRLSASFLRCPHLWKAAAPQMMLMGRVFLLVRTRCAGWAENLGENLGTGQGIGRQRMVVVTSTLSDPSSSAGRSILPPHSLLLYYEGEEER